VGGEGGLQSLPSDVSSVNMTQLLVKISDLVSAANFQRFPSFINYLHVLAEFLQLQIIQPLNFLSYIELTCAMTCAIICFLLFSFLAQNYSLSGIYWEKN
jgi:hypothetical protein